ncbi:hypothetical protein P280DRAFT_193536 [Massarina eburnea CBS 473.64]|uniref:Uncharacterized protein n=1 Tax=Massarina eburnea CBS 473.64 TaxID=1395130 RepID=A0A6A6RN61_9PLEO|nr:hypothetical protein P280DRAFT_193536 [Massarina eburnea CBS 473.64]
MSNPPQPPLSSEREWLRHEKEVERREMAQASASQQTEQRLQERMQQYRTAPAQESANAVASGVRTARLAQDELEYQKTQETEKTTDRPPVRVNQFPPRRPGKAYDSMEEQVRMVQEQVRMVQEQVRMVQERRRELEDLRDRKQTQGSGYGTPGMVTEQEVLRKGRRASMNALALSTPPAPPAPQRVLGRAEWIAKTKKEQGTERGGRPVNPDAATAHAPLPRLKPKIVAIPPPPPTSFPRKHPGDPDLIRNAPPPRPDDFSVTGQVIRLAQSPKGQPHDWTWSEHMNALIVAVSDSYIAGINRKLPDGLTNIENKKLMRDMDMRQPYVDFAKKGMQRRIDWRLCSEHVLLMKDMDLAVTELGIEELHRLHRSIGIWKVWDSA